MTFEEEAQLLRGIEARYWDACKKFPDLTMPPAKSFHVLSYLFRMAAMSVLAAHRYRTGEIDPYFPMEDTPTERYPEATRGIFLPEMADHQRLWTVISLTIVFLFSVESLLKGTIEIPEGERRGIEAVIKEALKDIRGMDKERCDLLTLVNTRNLQHGGGARKCHENRVRGIVISKGDENIDIDPDQIYSMLDNASKIIIHKLSVHAMPEKYDS